MAWAIDYYDGKEYMDLKINEQTKTFLTTADVGDEDGFIEAIKYTFGTLDDSPNDDKSDPNFTVSSCVQPFLPPNIPRGIRMHDILNMEKEVGLLTAIEQECDRASKPLLDYKFNNNKMCSALIFQAERVQNDIFVNINIIFNDGITKTIRQPFNIVHYVGTK